MDSQEFLASLLDTLHEDLNSKGHVKVANLPAISPSLSEKEMAEQFLAQRRQTDESIISALFSVCRF